MNEPQAIRMSGRDSVSCTLLVVLVDSFLIVDDNNASEIGEVLDCSL